MGEIFAIWHRKRNLRRYTLTKVVAIVDGIKSYSLVTFSRSLSGEATVTTENSAAELAIAPLMNGFHTTLRQPQSQTPQRDRREPAVLLVLPDRVETVSLKEPCVSPRSDCR